MEEAARTGWLLGPSLLLSLKEEERCGGLRGMNGWRWWLVGRVEEEVEGIETEWSSLCSFDSCLFTGLVGGRGSFLCLPPLRDGYSTTAVGSDLWWELGRTLQGKQ